MGRSCSIAAMLLSGNVTGISHQETLLQRSLTSTPQSHCCKGSSPMLTVIVSVTPLESTPLNTASTPTDFPDVQ